LRIVCAVSTPFQVNFFEELARRKPDNDYLFAARDRDATISMLENKGLPYVNLGGYNGRSLELKLKEFAHSLEAIGRVVKSFEPDLILTERYPPAVHVAHLADIPCWTIFNDEREFHVNRLTHPLAKKVFVPSFYQIELLRKQGVTDETKIVWFNGFITCYLKDAKTPEVNPFLDVDGYEEDRPVVLVRPEFEFSVFFSGYKPFLEEVVERLVKRGDLNVIVLPRTRVQRERYRQLGALMPDSALRGMPITHADVVIGSAETMLCEAFTLGVPAVSCIYWDLTVPMQVLHRHIPRANDPATALEMVTRFIDSAHARDEYKRTSAKVIGSMENPVDVMGRLLDLER